MTPLYTDAAISHGTQTRSRDVKFD